MSTTWLPALPPGWDVRRLGSLGRFTKGNGGSKEDDRDDGYPVVRYGELYTRFGLTITEPQSFIDDEATGRYTPLPKGTVVFTASGEDPHEIGKAAVSLLESPAFAGGDTILFTPQTDEVDVKFLAYALDSRPMRSMKAVRSTGFTVVHISAGKLKTLPIPLPPSHVQRAIAEFLDRETARIDDFIAKSERLISLLVERRAALSERVLAPHVGIGRRLKPYLPEVDVRAGSEWPDLPLLSVSIAWGVRRRDEVTDDEPAAEDLSNYKVAEQGDIVLNRMRAFQGALGVAPERGIVSPDYAVLRPADSVDALWAAAVMKTSKFVGEMTQRLKGIGSTDSGAVRTPRINVGDLGSILLDVPVYGAQCEAVVEIGSRALRIGRAIDAAERGINIARERRAALISAAVTGQLEVAA